MSYNFCTFVQQTLFSFGNYLLLTRDSNSHAKTVSSIYLKFIASTALMQFYVCFVCSQKDTRWVSQVMRKNKRAKGSKRFDLESEYGFRLMVPQRDFELGYNIATNIAEGIQKSRKIIFIVSRLAI